jgi:hypothetical protein
MMSAGPPKGAVPPADDFSLMERIRLGRTDLSVLRMGVGAGGPSQIGRKTGLDEAASMDLLLRAFDAGVNIVDTDGEPRSESHESRYRLHRHLQSAWRRAAVLPAPCGRDLPHTASGTRRRQGAVLRYHGNVQ